MARRRRCSCPLSADMDVRVAVADLRAALEGSPEGLAVYVTGAAGLSADLGNAFAGVDGLLLLVAVIAVLVILVVVYRSPSAADHGAACLDERSVRGRGGELLSGQGGCASRSTARCRGSSSSSSSAQRPTTRCCTSRASVRRCATASRSGSATKAAWKGSVAAILASGGTVIAGLLCLLLSDLASNKALGPVAALGIVFAVLVALTFLPGHAAPGRAGGLLAPPHRIRHRQGAEQNPRGCLGRIAGMMRAARPDSVGRRRDSVGARVRRPRRSEGKRGPGQRAGASASRRRVMDRTSSPPTFPVVRASPCR